MSARRSAVNYQTLVTVGCLPKVVKSITTPWFVVCLPGVVQLNTISGLWNVCQGSAVNYHPWFVGCLPGVVQSITTPWFVGCLPGVVQSTTISGLWDVCQGSTVNYHPLVCGLPARSTAINYHPLVCGTSARSSAVNYHPLLLCNVCLKECSQLPPPGLWYVFQE